MKKELYIPSSDERIKIYQKIKQNININHQFTNDSQKKLIEFSLKANNLIVSGQIQKKQRVLNSQELNNMLKRLTKDTKKQLILQKQITNIREQNIKTKNYVKEGNKVEERLLAQGKKIEQKKQFLRTQREEEEQKKLRQKPQISQKSKQAHQKPIHQRVESIIQFKKMLSKQLQIKYQPTFQPQIDPYSNFIAEVNKQTEGNFLTRMKTFQIKNQEKKLLLKQQVQKIEKRELKFQPSINNIYKRENSQRCTFQRQSFTKKILQNNSQISRFKPQINRHSSLLAKKKYTQQNCYQRLYQQSRINQDKILKKRQEQQKIYDFQPKINKKSRLIVQQKQEQKNQDWHEHFVQVIDNDDIYQLYQY